MGFVAGLEENICDVPLDGAGGLMGTSHQWAVTVPAQLCIPKPPFSADVCSNNVVLSSWDQHATLSGRQTSPDLSLLSLSPVGFAPTALISGAGGLHKSLQKDCRPLYVEGAVCYHFNASLHKCGGMRKAGGLYCSRPLRKTLSRLSGWSLCSVTVFIHIYSCRTEASRPATGLPAALLYIRMHLHLHPRYFPTIELSGLFLFLMCILF